MRLLVTGANGFTGKHFVSTARRVGYEVFSLLADLKDREALQQEMARVRPEKVIHLAAISFVGHAETKGFYDINTLGTLNLLDALTALAHPPQKIILASSANVYGNCEQSPIVEEQLPVPINHYAVSKLAMEYMASYYSGELPLLYVRPFNYTGTGQASSFLIPKLIDHYVRKAAKIELGNLHVRREFNDVRFVCESYLRLLEKGQPGEVYNVCSGRPVALQSVIELMNAMTGHEMKIEVNPAFVRANEIHTLCGSPKKLVHTVGEIPQPLLRETLQWIYDDAVGMICELH